MVLSRGSLLIASHWLFLVGKMRCTSFFWTVPFRKTSFRLYSMTSSDSSSLSQSTRVGIVGGGLAGLSTAFHLLEKKSNINITILDIAPVGTGGASSVAGGLIHPLSPRGKLIHKGREGLIATHKLVEHARQFQPNCVLREQVFRVALTQQHEQQLQQTAETCPEFCKWIPKEEMQTICTSKYALGGLKLSNGCKVIHVPLYLQGLWMACVESLQQNGEHAAIQWTLVDKSAITRDDWKQRLQEFDIVVLAAGSGLFHDSLLSTHDFPVDLIRGQSMEMSVSDKHYVDEALLCGKYISPLVEPNRVLIGATHEWKSIPLNKNEVIHDLKERSYQLAPGVWDHGKIDKITSGYRVQSRRGSFGRSPIIGKLANDATNRLHSNAWIFTGLSSRGLLHHGLYGDILTDAMLGRQNETMWNEYNLDWWHIAN